VFATIGHVFGMHHDYGGHIRRSVSSAEEVLALPMHDDPIKYAGLVLAQVGWNAGSRPGVEPGDFAVVVGDGLVGHWTAQTLLSRGANVIMIGKHDQRLAHFGGRIGASVVNASRDNWVEAVRDVAGPVGYRIGVDTVGSIDIMNTLSTTANRFGDIVSAGFYGAADHFRLQPARYGEHTIHLVSGWTRNRLERTLEAVATGELDTGSLITHRFGVADAADAWRLIESREQHLLGVVLDWQA
jgi:2-desacetyl-2-hydroxyethyl bacteriochlorophyllide A dehydrogenase